MNSPDLKYASSREPVPSSQSRPIAKVPLYVFRRKPLSEYEKDTYSSVLFSTTPYAAPEWDFVGPVGSVFEVGNAPAGARPLVQISSTVAKDKRDFNEVVLAPAQVGMPAYDAWLNSLLSGSNARATVLGAALPPDVEPPDDQFTTPLLCIRFEAEDSTQLADIVTTDLDVYANLAARKSTDFSTTGPITPLGAIAQIVPVFQVEVDHVGNVPIAMVTLGIRGPGPGDIEVPYGPGTLINFYPRRGSGVSVQSVSVTPNGTAASGFEVIQVAKGRVLISDTAPAGTYDYTLTVDAGAGKVGVMDPRIRNRTTLG